MKTIKLTNEERDLINYVLRLNYIDSNLEEYKEDKEFYKEQLSRKRISINIINKLWEV